MTDDFSRDANGSGDKGDKADKGDKSDKGGERRYGKPASGGARGASGSGERRYGKPAPRTGGAGSAGGSGERRYGKPATGSASSGGERRYGKPATGSASSGGERRYGKPAMGSASSGGERRFAKPAPRFARPASRDGGASSASHAPASGERRYGKPATGSASSGGDHRFAKPAPRFARPASRDGGAPSASHAPDSGERRYGKPATGSASSSGDHRFAKPAPRFARPASRDGGASSNTRAFTNTRPSSGTRSFTNNHSFNNTRTHNNMRPARPVAPVEETGLRLGARRIAFDILCDVHQQGAYAALSLNEHLRGKTLSPEDRRLVTNIVYGTLENELRIDFALDRLMEHPTREPSQRDILRMSAYQVLFLDRVPDSAAVNEAVKLCKVVGMEEASGFINAVLRNLVRGKDELPWPKKDDDIRQYLSIMGSAPLWLVDRLLNDYGAEVAEQILLYREDSHPVVVRASFTSFSDERLEKLLTDKGLRFEKGLAPHAYLVYGSSELNYEPDYLQGHFSMQGQSSMLAAEAVQAAPGMKVLDACAAPGGKSAYLCEKMQLTGRVFAWELHEKRAMLIEAAKRRLHLENLRITTRDATEPKPDLEGSLDAVLLDAPCSGTGVIAQKPDIKLRMTEEAVQEIVKTQQKLLDTLCRYVKPNGTLVYSTCSILREENAAQVERFLAAHPEFVLEPLPLSYPESIRKLQTPLGLQLLAHRDGVEGFFIARLRRTR